MLEILHSSAYSMGVLGKYPRASPLVSFTTNSRLVSFILNLAYPPVSLVWKGESVVLRVKICMEEGSPRLSSAGCCQGSCQWRELMMRVVSINIYARILIITRLLNIFG